jgi:pimeloyl-ACP methyl ester carboxylesterase
MSRLKEGFTMQTVTSKDGTTIAYDQTGDGPALIIVNGASATRGADAAVADLLTPGISVIAYDRRGRGDSGDTAPFAVEREVEDIEALLDAVGGSGFLMGHSSGAALALEAARLLPGKITKLVLYDPPFIIDDSRPPYPSDYLAHLTKLNAEGRRGDAMAYFMTCVGTPEEALAGMRQSPVWPGFEQVAPTLAYDAAVMEGLQNGTTAGLQRWASVATPTLVLDGSVLMGSAEAHVFMRHAADALAAVLPNARRQTLEGQDHGADPNVLAPVVREFLIG